LNRIEIILVKVEQRIKAYPQRRIQELRDAPKADWDEITLEEVLKVADSLPARMKAVIAAEGAYEILDAHYFFA
jgi:hypothetical protein